MKKPKLCPSGRESLQGGGGGGAEHHEGQCFLKNGDWDKVFLINVSYRTECV